MEMERRKEREEEAIQAERVRREKQKEEEEKRKSEEMKRPKSEVHVLTPVCMFLPPHVVQRFTSRWRKDRS